MFSIRNVMKFESASSCFYHRRIFLFGKMMVELLGNARTLEIRQIFFDNFLDAF